MVTVADQNVYPEQIEALISDDHAVALCAVICQEDTRRGHKIICVLVGDDHTSTVHRLREQCRHILGAESVPHEFVFVQSLPILAAGKPDLERLKQDFASPR
jgi:long-chain acyl-CoA synthetase